MKLPDHFTGVDHLEDVMTTPSSELEAELGRLSGDILILGVGGKMGPTLARMARRAAPGKRVIDIPLVRSWVEAAGYRGFHEVEIFSAANWWRRDPDEVLATCRERHQSCC